MIATSEQVDLDWLRENAPNTFAAVCRVKAAEPEFFPDLPVPAAVLQKYALPCPRCRKPMEYLPGRNGDPARWFCRQRLPYSRKFCGYETVERDE